MKKSRKMYVSGLVCLLMLVCFSWAEAVTTIHPDNFSFEAQVCADGGYWPTSGLTSSSPDWKTSGGAYIFKPSSSQIYPTGWCPAPAQGQQILSRISVGTTVYQLLPAQIQMGKTYTLSANAGDAVKGGNPLLYHPTAVLTLCAGTTNDPANWSTLSTYSLTLNSNGNTSTLSTSYAVTPSNYAAIAGKRLGIKLTYAQPTPPQQSVDEDLTWDNVSIAVSPDIKAESGVVVVNGVSTIPMGWFATYPTVAYPLFHEAPVNESQLHGFDYVMTYAILWGEGASTVGLMAYLDDAVTKGVKCVLDMSGANADAAQIAVWVNTVKNHPGIYGYYLEDEPDLQGLNHAALKTLYDTVKLLDPTRPVFVSFGAGLIGNIYIDCTDIVLVEVCNSDVVVPDPGYNNVLSSAAVCANAGKSYMVIPYSAVFAPYPSAATFRFWVLGSIAAGAGGIMPFMFEGDPAYPDSPSFAYWAAKRAEVVYPATDILKEISPVLLKGKQGLTVTDNIPNRTLTQPFTRTFKDGYARLAGDAYDAVLIGVYTNPGGNPIQVTFTLTGLDSQITTGTVVGENRTVTMTNGSFTDTFSPYGVHVYRFARYIYPSNYSFESPVVAPWVWGIPNSWASTGSISMGVGSSQPLVWHCYPPTNGSQALFQDSGTTIYQQLPNTIQAGVSYVLKADVGDGITTWPGAHPTYALTLCAGDPGSNVSTWTDLVSKSEQLIDPIGVYGSVNPPFYPKETPEYVGAGAAVGKRLGIKLTFISGPYSDSGDLQWDNVRIKVSPSLTTTLAIASADTSIVANAPNTNYGTQTWMQTEGYTAAPIESLVKFTLPSLPAGQSIISATFGVYAYGAASSPNTTSVYKVLTGWNENTVTWSNLSTIHGGGQPGVDYVANALFSQTLSSASWLSGDITSTVKDWYATPANNKGFVLISTPATGYNYLSIYTREAWVGYGGSPYLCITYGPTVQ